MSTNISVVMAVYNGHRYLLEQLRSVLAQLEEGDELIVIDDASSDDSADIVRQLAAPAIRLFTNPRNLGVVKSFERGLGLARQPFVFLCDQDDVWLPGKRAAYVAAFLQDPTISVVVSDAQLIDGDGGLVADSYMTTVRGGFDGSLLGTVVRNRFLGCVMAVRRDLLKVALPIPRGVPMHDMWLGMLGGMFGTVRYLPQPYLQYRRHGRNVSPLSSVASVYRMLMWRVNLTVAVGRRALARVFGMLPAAVERPPRMILVEQYFYPDGWGGAEIPRDISIALRQSGFDVEVLCGAEQYAPLSADHATRDPTSYGVNIRRIPKIIPGSVRRMRVLRLLWFCACAAPLLLLRRRVDVIATQTNPPLVVPVVAAVAAIRCIPFIIVAQDVYPEVLFASGALDAASFAGRALARLFSWAYRRADTVVTLGSFMKQRIRAKGVEPDRMVTISNWATGDVRCEPGPGNPLRAQWDLQQRFVVLYSGNLGVGHEFETFLAGVALAAARDERISVVFIGGGSRLEEVRGLTRQLGLENRVVFRDFVPAEQLPLSLGVSDLALVTLREGFEGVIVPSKLLGYMARGIPTLYVGPDSDVGDMIREANCGATCMTGESARVAEVLLRAANDPALLHQWSANSRAYYEGHFARDLAVRRYVDLIRHAARVAAE
jgi:colanic acid biosynthesis glycosyl transferase WcaI